MTPERLQEIIRAHWVDAIDTPDGSYAESLDLRAQRAELLGHIDLLHEDLAITRAERDAEKKKRAQEAKDHAAEVLAWDALAVDTRAKAWDEGYEEGRSDGWHDTRDNTPNPYRKDTK